MIEKRWKSRCKGHGAKQSFLVNDAKDASFVDLTISQAIFAKDGPAWTLVPVKQPRATIVSFHFSAAFSTALLGFNREAVVYCQGISDAVAHEYALNYARMLQNRAKGLQFSFPRIPSSLIRPHSNLIRTTLDRMCEKYFSKVRQQTC